MYGLVNIVIQELVCSKFGIDSWNEVKYKAKVEDEFMSMESYPDALTYDLATTASEVLSVPLNDLLESLGEYWIVYVENNGYEDLMETGGSSVYQFLNNLNNFHDRLGSMFPQQIPPVFKCREIDKNRLQVRYFSDRPALAPMVKGLIQGLGKRFKEEITVELVSNSTEQQKYDEFEVKYEKK